MAQFYLKSTSIVALGNWVLSGASYRLSGTNQDSTLTFGYTGAAWQPNLTGPLLTLAQVQAAIPGFTIVDAQALPGGVSIINAGQGDHFVASYGANLNAQ